MLPSVREYRAERAVYDIERARTRLRFLGSTHSTIAVAFLNVALWFSVKAWKEEKE